MGKALYRKYRPKTLAEVVGEEQVTGILENAIKEQKISHAYLFIGPRGCGKTSVARIFAHAINNFDYELEDDYVDIIEIDAASNTGVDNIRELREKACIAPTKGKYKVYIIDEVHMLSKSAFNALLKTLEEPPKHVVFIMATTDAYKIPVTITSRAQTYTFKLADAATMHKFLKDVSAKEKIQIDDDALDIIVRRGGGSFRDSLSLLDQVSTLTKNQITKELLLAAFGLPENEKLDSLLNCYAASDLNGVTECLKTLLNSGVKPETVAEELIDKIIANPAPALLPLLEKLPNVQAPFPEAKLLAAFIINAPVTAPIAKLATPVTKPTAEKSYSEPKKSYSEPEKTRSNDEQKITEEKSPKIAEKKSYSEPNETQSEQKETQSEEIPTKSTVEDFLKNIQNQATAKFLEQSDIEIIDGTINIYPKNKFALKGLQKDQHHAVMTAATTLKIVVHEEKNPSEKSASDPLVSKISGIMGGAEEVNTNGGKVPF